VKIYPVFIPHAGCPHRCIFCAQDKTSGQSTAPTPGELEDWLDETLPLKGDGEIAFYGGSFSLLPRALQEQYLAVARIFVADERVFGIRVSTRPDALDRGCLDRLKALSVSTVEIGCQSFSPSVLSTSGRGHSVEDNNLAIRNSIKSGLQVGVQLMPGLPGGDIEEALLSLRRVLELKPSFVRIYPAVVIEGTELAGLWKNGGYKPWTLDKAVDVCADMLHHCRLANIPVIRLGLQCGPELDDNVLAGPYHPAFGQLVRSRLWRRVLLYIGSYCPQVNISSDDLSDALGHRGENREWLVRHGAHISLSTDNTIQRGFVRVSGEDIEINALLAQGGVIG
jgi:histone acetyltransferase (RNA polymerase elongator complex component)